MSAPPPPVEAPAGPPGPLPYRFFTGYSDSDNLARVQRFHEDVEKEVRQEIGPNIPGEGFLDFQDVVPGERWEDRIVANGVCTARAMVALYSTSYFQSHWCAHEWTVFTARLSQYRLQAGAEIPYLIGVRWQRTRKAWPEEVTAFQYVRRDPGSDYERRGLVNLVPDRPEDRGTKEYREIVEQVADVIVNAHHNPLPALEPTDMTQLGSAFGPESSLAIDIVLTYSPENVKWGEWVHEYLAVDKSRDVAVLPPECLSRAPVRLLRNSLARARRVVMLVSRHSLAEPGPNKEVLEEIYDDPDLVDDLPRLVPLFVEDLPDEVVPARLLPKDGRSLHGIPDRAAVQEIILDAVDTPVRPPVMARRPEFGFPSDAASPFDSELADKLAQASSLRDKDLRPIWFQATGLDTSQEPDRRLNTRTWAFAVILAAKKLEDGYERLAAALEGLDNGAPETIEVRKFINSRNP